MKLREQMMQDLNLAGHAESTRKAYLVSGSKSQSPVIINEKDKDKEVGERVISRNR